MIDDDLSQLLKKADDHAVGVGVGTRTDLATRVRSRHARRRVIRTGVIGSLLVILCIGSIMVYPELRRRGLLSIPEDQSVEIATHTTEVASIRSEIEALDRQAKLHEAIANRMIQIERRPKMGTVSTFESPEVTIATSINTAAGILVYDSDRRFQSEQFRESAIEGYRLAVTLFPNTLAAQVATERLRLSGNL